MRCIRKLSLPAQKLHFIHAEELRQLYPDLEPKCREQHAITKNMVQYSSSVLAAS